MGHKIDRSYKTDFVKGFAELFMSEGAKSHYESHGVVGMEMDEENEVVIIDFGEGYIKKVSVVADSLSAIAYDIIRHGLW